MLHRLSLLIALLLTSTALQAKKNNPRADLKVSYNYHNLYLRDDGEVLTRDWPYILLSNPEESKFYCISNEYMDSLDSTPSGRALSHKLMSAGVNQYLKTGDDSGIPHCKGYMYIFKSRPQNTTTVYDAYGLMERGYYTEPFAEIDWQIGDSTKTVLGYECISATADYHGRHWTAWFTTDIPLSEGPWKLCGLPGLILEASEESGQHSFTANGIEKTDMEMFPIYSKKKYDKMDRKKMLKAYRNYRNNSGAVSRQILANGPDESKIDIPEIKPKENTQNFDFLETDYH